MGVFADRQEAGKLLAKKLAEYRGTDAVIIALPRGGVVTGAEVARALHLPLDIAVVRKIGHPQNPEYAICVTDEKGISICNEAEARAVDQDWLKEEIERQRKEAERRIAAYRGKEKRRELGGKTVIVVDDGIATGLTMRGALLAIRKEHPKKLVVAVPAAPYDAELALREEVDSIVILEDTRHYLGAVGAYYDDFPQVSDEEVIDLLKEDTLKKT
ncbi:MAG: hypothetical protein A2808_03940 [Candidatus Moranbacteria bacterium RIFCSPHIGHO2_01_FULL_55_24]|nr:MAG: hypothetical protein A2808_03940 [Candidatus Moranbacteria bacterium RIFCSPHIGHO2_01_FULL_55_24]